MIILVTTRTMIGLMAGFGARPVLMRVPDAATAVATIGRLDGRVVLVDRTAIDLLDVGRGTAAATIAVSLELERVAEAWGRDAGNRMLGLLDSVDAVVLIESDAAGYQR